MSNINLKQILLCSSLLVGASAFAPSVAFAQDVNSEIENEEAQSIIIEDEELVEESGDTIVVTG